jgi:hypothetical protein
VRSNSAPTWWCSLVPVREGGRVRLDVRLQETERGELLVSAAEEGTEDEIFALVTRAGARIRGALDMGSLTEAAASEVRASLPSKPEAARLYALGLDRLRVFDALGARERLEDAVAAEPQHPLPHAALAEAVGARYDSHGRGRRLQLAGRLRARIASRWRRPADERRMGPAIEIRTLSSLPDRLDYPWACGVEAAPGQAKTLDDRVSAPAPSARLQDPAWTSPRPTRRRRYRFPATREGVARRREARRGSCSSSRRRASPRAPRS